MQDQYNRTIEYMRISITDRCNLRCRYCMPNGIDLVPMENILTYEQITDICRMAAELGIRKLKITGGEPLVRLGAPGLIRELKRIPGIDQVTLTTNGVLLKRYLQDLLDAGLDAVNISLDTVRRDRYKAITGRDGLPDVMDSLEAAISAGLRVKINCVLQEDMNADEWPLLAEMAKDRPLDVRFIEMMPIGYGKGFAGVSNETVFAGLERAFPEIEADAAVHGNGPAVYYRIPGWKGSVGFISAIHGRFCSSCNRIRLTSQGKLKPCLCYGDSIDLMPILRRDADPDIKGGSRDEQLREALLLAIRGKPLQHCFEAEEQVTETSRMASIGG